MRGWEHYKKRNYTKQNSCETQRRVSDCGRYCDEGQASLACGWALDVLAHKRWSARVKESRRQTTADTQSWGMIRIAEPTPRIAFSRDVFDEPASPLRPTARPSSQSSAVIQCDASSGTEWPTPAELDLKRLVSCTRSCSIQFLESQNLLYLCMSVEKKEQLQETRPSFCPWKIGKWDEVREKGGGDYNFKTLRSPTQKAFLSSWSKMAWILCTASLRACRTFSWPWVSTESRTSSSLVSSSSRQR